MSRNPILTDKAFGLDGSSGSGGLSPAQEWQRAQSMGAGPATGTVPPSPPGYGVPPDATTAASAGTDAALARVK